MAALIEDRIETMTGSEANIKIKTTDSCTADGRQKVFPLISARIVIDRLWFA